VAVDAPLVIPVVVVSVAIVIATITDLRSFKIHNLLTIPLLISGLAYHGLVTGQDGFVSSVLGALFGFGVLALFFLVGGVGGGDVKLLAGVGAWLGLFLTFWLFNAAALAAGLYAVVLTVVNGRVRETWMNLRLMGHRLLTVGRHLGTDERVEEVVQRSDRRRQLIPFGAMMGVGLLVILVIVRLRPGQ
jgi:prepilin peptidase CpaA